MNGRRRLLAIAAAALAAALANAQPLGAQERGAVVEALASAFAERYVDAELAKQGATLIRKHLKEGKYDAIESGPLFAKQLSDELNALCKDAHLRIRHSAQVLPVRAERSEPSPEEIAAAKRATRQRNAGYENVGRMDGNVGYLETRMFASPAEAARPAKAAMEFLKDADALIVDLRRNGGGDPAGVQLLCSYLFGEKPVHLNSLYFRRDNKTTEFWTLPSVPGPRFEGKPVYVVVGPRTGSGAEEFAYNLQNLKRATIVGKPTWGGANPGGEVRLGDHFSAFIPVGKAINPYTKTNWEGTGVIPDVDAPVDEALKVAHKMALEELLKDAKTDEDRARFGAALKALG